MNVLWHMPTLRAHTCGLSRRALRFAGALREAGHDVTFLVDAARSEVGSRFEGFPVEQVEIRRVAPSHWSLQALSRRAMARRLIRGSKTIHDLFITCQPEAVLAYQSARWAAPCVFVCGGTTLLHDDADATRILADCVGVQRLWNLAALTMDRRLKRDTERRAVQCAEAVVFNSQTTLRLVQRAYESEGARLAAIVGGVDTVAFQPPTTAQRLAARAALGLAGESFVVAWTGRMSLEKGLDHLLHAARVMNGTQTTLLLAGDGPQRPTLETAVRNLGLAGRVRFIGAVEDVRPVLHAADAYVFPSRGESFGNALAEAMACGLPCIGLRPNGRGVKNANVELLDDGRAGLLVDANSPTGLADAITMLDANRSDGADLGRAARRRAELMFCWRAAGRRFVRLAERVGGVARSVVVESSLQLEDSPATRRVDRTERGSRAPAAMPGMARERLKLRPL